MISIRRLPLWRTGLAAIAALLALPGTVSAQTDPLREPWKLALVPTYALGTDTRTETSGELALRGFGAALEVAASRWLVGTVDARRLTFPDVTCLGVDLPCSARNGWSVLAGGNYMILTPGRVPIGAYLGAAAGVVNRHGSQRAAAVRLGIDLPVMASAAIRLESSYLRYDEEHSADPRLLTWTGGLRIRLR